LCVLPVVPRPFGSGRIRQPPPSLRTTRPARIPRPCLTLEAGSLHSVFRAQPHPHTPENASQRPLRDGSLSTALTPTPPSRRTSVCGLSMQHRRMALSSRACR